MENTLKNPVKVYIDFEAITNPFARIIKIPNSTPYCYTLGLINDKGVFESHTFVMNFKNNRRFYTTLRQAIIRDIKRINPQIKFRSIEFIGHNPVLENKCLKRLFPKNVVSPLIEQQTISLSLITRKKFNDNYFLQVKKIIASQERHNVFRNRILEHNGAIASYVGFLLYCKDNNFETNKRYYIDIDKRLLIRELKEYSHDDVWKMEYVAKHISEVDMWLRDINHKRELLKQLNTLDVDENMTLKEFKEKIWDL